MCAQIYIHCRMDYCVWSTAALDAGPGSTPRTELPALHSSYGGARRPEASHAHRPRDPHPPPPNASTNQCDPDHVDLRPGRLSTRTRHANHCGILE